MAEFYYRLWQTILHILSNFTLLLCKVVRICVQSYVQSAYIFRKNSCKCNIVAKINLKYFNSFALCIV